MHDRINIHDMISGKAAKERLKEALIQLAPGNVENLKEWQVEAYKVIAAISAADHPEALEDIITEVKIWKELCNELEAKTDLDREAINIALDLAVEGKYELAQHELRLVFADNSSGPILQSVLGNIQFRNGDLEAAIDSYNKCLALGHETSDMMFIIGKAYFELGNVKKAIKSYKKAIELNPENVSALNSIGLALCDRGIFNGALHYLEKASVINPKNLENAGLLGNVYFYLKQYDKAVTVFEKLIEDYHQKYPIILGRSLLDVPGVFPGTDFNETATGHDLALHLCNLGTAYNAQGNYEKAIETFERSRKMDEYIVRPITGLGDAYQARGMTDEALKFYRLALEKTNYLLQHNAAFTEEIAVGAVGAERGLIKLEAKDLSLHNMARAIKAGFSEEQISSW